MNLFIKILITLIITALGIYPYIGTNNIPGALDALHSFGIIPAIILIIVFFIAIGFYCKSLQTTLELIKPENRKANPKSVWLMFLIPYNFFEDFFIMINISNSLEEEFKINDKLKDVKDFGLITGLGWATAQVLSFFPNEIGQISGLIGLVLWIKHWLFINKINQKLIHI